MIGIQKGTIILTTTHMGIIEGCIRIMEQEMETTI